MCGHYESQGVIATLAISSIDTHLWFHCFFMLFNAGEVSVERMHSSSTL